MIAETLLFYPKIDYIEQKLDFMATAEDFSVVQKNKASKAEGEYAEFNKTQKLILDFDQEIKRLLDSGS